MGRVTEAQIRRAAKAAGIPYQLFYAVVGQESGGRTGAVSPKGARGAAQLMPGTARELERRYGINTKTPYGNLLGGAFYLKEQLDRFGSVELALAAYNAGPGRVKQYGGIPPIPETQRYVKNIMARAGLTDAKVPSPIPTGGGGVPGSPTPAAPAPLSLDAVLAEGLRDLAEGDYNPQRGLQGILEAQEAAKAAPTPQVSSGAIEAYEMPQEAPQSFRGKGITFNGQKLTHDTDGLAGYPAVDIFAAPGTPFLAPEDGRIVRLSGRGGTSGPVYGWSVYFQGKSGRMYFITHLGKERAGRGQYRRGDVLGVVSPWKGGRPHAHVGVKQTRRKGR